MVMGEPWPAGGAPVPGPGPLVGADCQSRRRARSSPTKKLTFCCRSGLLAYCGRMFQYSSVLNGRGG